MKLLILIFAAIFFTAGIGIAQKNQAEQRYYINLRGDTISGNVSLYKDWTKSAIKFYAAGNNNLVTDISFDSCKGFRSENQLYHIFEVAKNMTYIDKFDLSLRNPDSVLTARTPLKILYSGHRFILYHFKDVKDHFFIQEGLQLNELVMSYRPLTQWEKDTFNGMQFPSFYSLAIYKQQFTKLMKRQLTTKEAATIEFTDYDENQMIRLITKMDQW